MRWFPLRSQPSILSKASTDRTFRYVIRAITVIRVLKPHSARLQLFNPFTANQQWQHSDHAETTIN